MRKLLTFFAISLLTMSGIIANDTIPANNKLIEYSGRIDFSDSLAPKFSYSGVSVRAAFTGTSIGVVLSDDRGGNYYYFIVDGKILKRQKVALSKTLYVIAEGLENSIHEVEIFKISEQEFGKTQFHGIVIDQGSQIVELSNKRTRLIEFIGNSITCGYSNEGINGTDKFSAETENHYLTYAAITSRSFNARHIAVCRSGIGIYRNYGTAVSGSTDCMPNFYKRIFLNDATPEYDFQQTPDVVCINLGTNDFWDNKPDSAKFVSSYFKLIDTIQAKYSNTDIICIAGPMLWGNGLTLAKKYIAFIADSATKKANGTVSFFELTAQAGALGVDYHPSVAQHIGNAEQLTEFISKLKRWDIIPQPVISNTITNAHISLEFNSDLKVTENLATEFSFKGDIQYSIKQAYKDANNSRVLHFILNQAFKIGENIECSYTAGSLQTEAAQTVNSFKYAIVNNLKSTVLNSAKVLENGEKLIVTLNKSINSATVISGLTIIGETGDYEIKSFTISGKDIRITLTDKIKKGESVKINFSGSGILGTDNVELEAFSNFWVSNSSIFTDLEDEHCTDFKIYPNPNNTKVFNYDICKSSFFDYSNLEISDLSGKILHTQKLYQSMGVINLPTNFPSGTFLIKFYSDTFLYESKLVLE
ncbi:MAG: T9SS type A sorting domain-containing protein [Bacteroidales bacterium]|nr:T9SS type A sorting domain-containing protein [Bacteroidales bacterium]